MTERIYNSIFGRYFYNSLENIMKKHLRDSIKDYTDKSFDKIPEVMVIDERNNTLKVFNYNRRRI